MFLRARSTADVSLKDLDALRADLAPEISLVVEGGQIRMLSADPPSWVSFLADAPWWVQTLGLYASVYVAELFKEAAKTTWKERASIASAASRGAGQIARLARVLVRFSRSRRRDSQLRLALPIPNDYFGVSLEIIGREEDLVAAEIALFVRHVPAIEALLGQEAVRSRITGLVAVQLLEDGSAKLTWMNKETLDFEESILPLQ